MGCSACKQDLPEESFRLNRTSRRGRQSVCRNCQRRAERNRVRKRDRRILCPSCGGKMNKTSFRCMKCRRDPLRVRPEEWSEAETAWLAGIIEGEGSIITEGRRVRISIQMTDEDIIQRVAKMWSRVPTTHVPNAPEGKQWKTTYVTGVGASEDVQKVLEVLLPWLGIRRSEKARQALQQISGN